MGDIKIGGLAGEEAGEGVPVVLLHGLTATRRYVVMGSKNLERNGHRVVMYDARGHGRSEPADSYGYDALATDLLAVLDDRGIDRAVLAGASMGAHTIVRFALEHPSRAAALVLITPAFDPEPHDRGLDQWDALSEGLRTGGVDGFLEAYGEPHVPESFRETVRTVLRQRLSAHEHPDAVADALREVPRSPAFELVGGAFEAGSARDGRGEPRRGRSRAPFCDRRAVCGDDPGRAAGERGARQVALGVAGRAAVARDRGDRRSRLGSGERQLRLGKEAAESAARRDPCAHRRAAERRACGEGCDL